MRERLSRLSLTLPVVVAVLLLDQVTKIWVQLTLPEWTSVSVIPGFFNIVHVLNRGAVFGFLNDPNLMWPSYLFMGAAGLAVVLISYLILAGPRRHSIHYLSLALIMGGAMGNLVDRIRIGYVIDFLDVHIGAYHWPAFNVADAAICLGALGLVLCLATNR